MGKKESKLKTLAIAAASWMGVNHPVTLVRLRYLLRFHRLPRLKNPSDLNEKVLWLKLFSDTSEWTRLADKHLVRDYVREKGLDNMLLRHYGVWQRAEDVDFESLPDSFILKVNNGAGNGEWHIIKSKSKLTLEDISDIRREMDGWLRRKNVGAPSAEPQYRDIKPLIIAEELLKPSKGAKSIEDYKIFCFNGEPYCTFTCSDRPETGGGAQLMLYDAEWNPQPQYLVPVKDYPIGGVEPRPYNYDAMIDAARRLSAGFPVVRVDLYNVDGKIYFGELTFTSQGGMDDGFTPEWLMEAGSKIDLSRAKLKK